MIHDLNNRLTKATKCLRDLCFRPSVLICTALMALVLLVVVFWSYKQWYRTSTLLTGRTVESTYFQDLSHQLSDEYATTMTILPAWSGRVDKMKEVLTPDGISYVERVKDRDFSIGRSIVATYPWLTSYVCLVWGGEAESYKDFIEIYSSGTLNHVPRYRSQFILNHEMAHCIHRALPSWNSGLSDEDLIKRVSEVIAVDDPKYLDALVRGKGGISLHESYVREAFADLYAMHKLKNDNPSSFTRVMTRHFQDRQADAQASQLSHLTQLQVLMGVADVDNHKGGSSGKFAEGIIERINERSSAGFLDILIIGHIAATKDPSSYTVLKPGRFRDAKMAYQATRAGWSEAKNTAYRSLSRRHQKLF